MFYTILSQAKLCHEFTVLMWLSRAAQKAHEINTYLLRELPVTEVQLDEMWSFIKRKQAAQQAEADVESSDLNEDGRQWAWISLIERLNLTLRHALAPLVRKSRCFCKDRTHMRRRVTFFQAFYNFVRPHMSLRLPLPEQEPSASGLIQPKWQHRTHGMTAGLTDHVWTFRELLTAEFEPAKKIAGQQNGKGYEYNMPACWITGRHGFERCNNCYILLRVRVMERFKFTNKAPDFYLSSRRINGRDIIVLSAH